MENCGDNEEPENRLERDMISRFGKLGSDERTNLLRLVSDARFQLEYLRAATKIMKNTTCLEYSSRSKLIEAYNMVDRFIKDSVVKTMVEFCSNAVNLAAKVPRIEDLAWRLSVQVVSEVFPALIEEGTEAQLRMKFALRGFKV